MNAREHMSPEAQRILRNKAKIALQNAVRHARQARAYAQSAVDWAHDGNTVRATSAMRISRRNWEDAKLAARHAFILGGPR